MKKGLKRVLVIGVVLLVLLGIVVVNVMENQRKQMDQLEFGEIDMNRVTDGDYEGKADTSLVKAKVVVSVKAKHISAIQILQHDNGKGKPAEVIVDNMVENNTYDVDAVSGATTSSKVIKYAVYNALKQGIK